jgi:uncharacterized protein YbbC (DUF1343 family)
MKKIIQKQTEKVILGCENFLANHLDLVIGKRLGLITNPTGVDSHLNSLIDLFHENPHIDLVALYGPEHGVRGNAQAGEYVPFYRDEKYCLPVFSLYGQSMEQDTGMLRDMDECMRSFDTTETGKLPEDSMIENVDVMVFDIQDIGTRIYTYISTLAYCMEICAKNGIEFIVLDRPNPINGVIMEGPLLEYPEFSSFVGLFPIPIRHATTIGELAKLFNERFCTKKVRLTVIPMKGWKRTMWYDQTSLPWVSPSPNMPTLRTATVYPGQVFLEGTNISEGRGTATPFEIFGAPWIDGQDLTENLNRLHLQGVLFRETRFTPYFSKFKGKSCNGASISVLDRNIFQPFMTTLHVIKTVKDMYPDIFRFHKEYFDRIVGSSSIRRSIEKGSPVDEIVGEYSFQLEEFTDQRKSYLLY